MSPTVLSGYSDEQAWIGERPSYLCLEDIKGHTSILVGGQGHDPESSHLRAGSIGAMGRVRDEADLAVLLSLVPMVGHDGAQTSKLTLGTTTHTHTQLKRLPQLPDQLLA